MRNSYKIISSVSFVLMLIALNSFAGVGGAFIQQINISEGYSRIDITLGYRLPNSCYEISNIKGENKIDNNGIQYRLVPETRVNSENCVDNFKVPGIIPNLATTIELYTFTIENPEEGPYTIVATGSNGELVKKFVYVKSETTSAEF